MSTFPVTAISTQAAADEPRVELDESGRWRYAGTEIPAVGARSVTLAEVVDPPIIARAGQEPEAVLLPLSTLIADARLNWVLQAGTKLDGDGEQEPLFRVPWSVWQEHASLPVAAWMPERDATGVDRALAKAERDYRFAKKAFEQAGLLRNQVVLVAIRLGRSRRQIGELIDLSAARVQQLSDSPEGERHELIQFLATAAWVAVGLADEPLPVEKLQVPGLGGDELEQMVASMKMVGLIEDGPGGLHLTDDGRDLFRSSDKPDRKRRGRVTDAAK